MRVSPERFKALRVESGLKGADFAHIIGVSKAYVSMIESGKKPYLDDEKARILCRRFRKPDGWLVNSDLPTHDIAAEQAAGLAPPEETRPRLESAPSAPSAVKAAGKKGQADELRAIRDELNRLSERLNRLLGG